MAEPSGARANLSAARRPPAVRTEEFLGLPLACVDQNGLIGWLLASDPTPRVAAYLNAHTVNLALAAAKQTGTSPWHQCDLLYADGMAVVWGARRHGVPVPERVTAADFFLRFCWAAAAAGRTIALVGSTEQAVRRCTVSLETNIRGLNIVHLSGGYHRAESVERREVVRRLEECRPDVVLLGMGSPQQEEFALELREQGNLGAVWCVGALFDYHDPEGRSRGPLWMREAGLEWACRLALEPRRLAGRYLLGNLLFLLRLGRLI